MRDQWEIHVCSECGKHLPGKYNVTHDAGCSRIGRHANQTINVVQEGAGIGTELLGYLDECIRHWRARRDKHRSDSPEWHTGACYVDAFQSVRMSIFGETLPE